MNSMYQSVVEAEEDEEGEDLEEDGEGGDVGENLQSKRFQFKKVHKQKRLLIPAAESWEMIFFANVFV